MKTALVGYTGFVGSNLAAGHTFTHQYNSGNIEAAYGTKPELLVYAGVRAEKFLANSNPEKDLEAVREAFENIRKIAPEKLVLISTIDVYRNPVGVDEDSVIETEGLHPYGLNRYQLEQWVREEYPDALIIRLPGLYGRNLKKNFIYDFIHVIPSMLKEEKFLELCEQDSFIQPYYKLQDNGFYKCTELTPEETKAVKEYFQKIGFSAMNFTDSRGSFQFYHLKYLWPHIETALQQDLRLVNIATEPIRISELYTYLTGEVFTNEVANVVPDYDFRTKHAAFFGGTDGYIFDKDTMMRDLKEFVDSQM